MSIRRCATMWLPRPMEQPRPIRITMSSPKSSPGQPTARLTPSPTRVPSPMAMYRSL
ncbi:hypothetical protein ACFQ9X_51415 [Catenulispora yoronensis]